MRPAPLPWQPPITFGEYRLLHPLGRGAMGEVYVAHDTLLDRQVAVKFISGVTPDAALRERFRTEARAIARVRHPNVVDIHRVGEVQGRPYLVSEWVRGESLDRLPRPQPWPRVLTLGIGLARGLSAAHRRGVLHRDIKPANAMLTDDGEVKLLDFGVAKLLDVTGAVSPLLPEERAVSPLLQEEGTPGTRARETRDVARTATVEPMPRTGLEPLPATGRIGTPLYMAPEVWRGESATARCDVYSLGVLLYELCCGAPPHPADTLEALREAVVGQPFIPLLQVAPRVEPAFAAILSRCLAREPAERFASADALREALEALQERAREDAGPRERPYPGLHSFTPAERATFLGRAAHMRAVLDRLRAEPWVLVAGDSGAGKSSLCRAGVLPRVAEGALGAPWLVCEVLPGRRPLRALMTALAQLPGLREAELLESLRESPVELARRVLAACGTRGLLVFVDALEEVLTLAAPDEAERFVEVLVALTGAGSRLRLLATARGDFLARLADVPGLGVHLSAGLYLLPHLDAAGLREAIIGPARTQAFTFETEAMVDTLVAAGRGDGGLPLLQFTLAELWERRDRERKVVPAEALELLGGVEGALARYADGVLAGMRPGQRAAARRLLPRLVLAEGTRARRTRTELLAGEGEGREALEALVQGRLLLAREADAPGEGTYELAHEALVRGWDTLRGWLAGDEEQRALRQRLERASAEWRRLGCASELLWSGRQLEEASRLEVMVLSAGEGAFLRASRRGVWRRRAVRAVALLLLPLTAAFVYGGGELRAARARSLAVAEALAAAERFESRAQAREGEVEALRQQAFAAFDAKRSQDAELTWARALSLEASMSRDHEEATRVLESALLRDGQHPMLRTRLAEVLHQRILLAERDRRHEARGLLEQRLEAVDDGGEHRRRLSEAARLNLDTSPPGAEVWMERSVNEEGRLHWSAPERMGTTPLVDAVLPPGSYRLTFRTPERPAVLYPVLLGRGERFRASIPVPAQVPEGYVYVPPGRFLYGSGDDELIRRTLVRTRPLHEVHTEGFFIARHEVTYGDWLAFLRTLPPGERASRRPVGTNQFGTIELVERAEGAWELVITRPGHVYRAREWERLHYEERTRFAAQDWLRFPVSAISWEDARAYVAWLDRTGRPRGARLCGELEWERAARGADGRDYPHGQRLEPQDANVDIAHGRRALAFGPDAVGSYPASDSPFGVADLAGNVWEWMVTTTPSGTAAYGGGSFYQDVMTARSLNHGDGEPLMRNPFVGIRVCAEAPAP